MPTIGKPMQIDVSDTGVGSSLEEFRALEFGGHPPFSLDKWDGVLSITTTSINEKVIQHYRLNLQEIVSSTRMRLKRLPCTSKHVGTFSGTEVCFSTEEENIDEFVAWVVKFVQKMHVLNDHETFVDLLVEIIDNHGSKHVQFLPGNRSSSATSRPMSNVECLYYGLIDYKLQQRGSVEVACSTRREDFKVGIGNACGLRNGRHTVDVAVLVVPLGSIACCLGARSQNTEIQKHAPALSRTIACLVTSSKDEEFQAECARLLGLEAASACNEMLELRIRDKLTETIAMNDLKHKKAKDMAPDLFQCEPVNAENCLEKYDDEDCGPSRHIPFRYFLDTNFTFTYLPPFFAICPLHPHCSIFHESSKMETLAAPEAPNLDSLPSERDEPVLLPVEEIRNPTGDNAEEESPFTVGDFVWAKAKGHPWWLAIISSPRSRPIVS
ncbi:hypothetical protein HPP92_021828 [Vanilla planifolia]|uniref:PWWP domain-containing protein n=1 Tax=Vanilla planifolia TaxID=51239 RepID=A0A835UJC9_VANPL|nr:hypothetical protein HPP92_021828 [Vanilla planifolia]